MSCEACHDFQESDKTTYFRWTNANIEIRACEKHLKEVFGVLRAAIQEKIKAQGEPNAK